MFGWLMAEAARASRRNLIEPVGEFSPALDITLMATVRRRTRSSALYTSPMPPEPSFSMIRYFARAPIASIENHRANKGRNGPLNSPRLGGKNNPPQWVTRVGSSPLDNKPAVCVRRCGRIRRLQLLSCDRLRGKYERPDTQCMRERHPTAELRRRLQNNQFRQTGLDLSRRSVEIRAPVLRRGY